MKKLKGDIIDKEITAEEFIKMYENGDFFELRKVTMLKSPQLSSDDSNQSKQTEAQKAFMLLRHVPLSAAILKGFLGKEITADESNKTSEDKRLFEISHVSISKLRQSSGDDNDHLKQTEAQKAFMLLRHVPLKPAILIDLNKKK